MPQSNNNNNIINNTNNNNNTTNCRISPKDRLKISRDHKKIKCLDTLSKKHNCTISQVEKIVKEKKKKIRPITTNSHLVSLLDKVVYEWFQRAQKLVETGTITEEMFLQKAHESKQIFGITDFLTDYEWVRNFRKKYNITNLDMTMLRIENDNRPMSVDINDIVMFVLKSNPITDYLSYTCPQDNSNTTGSILQMSEINPNPTQYLICYDNNIDNNNINETIIPETFDNLLVDEVKLEVLPVPVITNDEQAKRHLKPLEDYVLLKENFRAIGLIAQLEEMFATQTNEQKIVLTDSF